MNGFGSQDPGIGGISRPLGDPADHGVLWLNCACGLSSHRDVCIDGHGSAGFWDGRLM